MLHEDVNCDTSKAEDFSLEDSFTTVKTVKTPNSTNEVQSPATNTEISPASTATKGLTEKTIIDRDLAGVKTSPPTTI